MIRFLLGCLMAITGVSMLQAEDKPTEREFTTSFSVPNPSWKAKITEARSVGNAIWVRVDVASDGGIAASVIKKLSPTAKFVAPKGDVRYIVYGKTWKWKNKEEGVTFLADLDEKDRKATEKAYSEGKVITTGSGK